jgi:DNA-binding SARP family transcriptional activator
LAAVRLGPPKQRAVLALLAMHADRVVPTDLIVDALWGDTPPANPLGSLQVYVSHLRRLLDPVRTGRPPTVLVSAAHGTA